jgi:Na+-transporting methylmalonyl-CoA/oxaloacetate decarboxylase gamma subunit
MNNKNKLYVRILAWVLALLMILSLALLGIELIVSGIHEKKEAERKAAEEAAKEQQEQTDDHDDHEGHNHD